MFGLFGGDEETTKDLDEEKLGSDPKGRIVKELRSAGIKVGKEDIMVDSVSSDCDKNTKIKVKDNQGGEMCVEYNEDTDEYTLKSVDRVHPSNPVNPKDTLCNTNAVVMNDSVKDKMEQAQQNLSKAQAPQMQKAKKKAVQQLQKKATNNIAVQQLQKKATNNIAAGSGISINDSTVAKKECAERVENARFASIPLPEELNKQMSNQTYQEELISFAQDKFLEENLDLVSVFPKQGYAIFKKH